MNVFHVSDCVDDDDQTVSPIRHGSPQQQSHHTVNVCLFLFIQHIAFNVRWHIHGPITKDPVCAYPLHQVEFKTTNNCAV